MGADHFFNIFRENIKTARDNHVLFAIENVQKAIFIHLANIATAQEGAASLIAPNGGLGLLRPVVVLLHEAAAVADDLARFTRGKLATLIIDNPQIEPNDRRAHGPALVLLLRPTHRGKALREAIELEQASVDTLEDGLLRVLAQGRPGR